MFYSGFPFYAKTIVYVLIVLMICNAEQKNMLFVFLRAIGRQDRHQFTAEL